MKKAIKHISFIILCYLLTANYAIAQTQEGSTTNTVGVQKVNSMQPVIIVIPRVNEGQDIRTVLDDPKNGFNLRLGVSKVKEAFDNEGFTTKSFEGTLKIALDNKLFTSESQTDMKAMIAEMSAADIYVEVDISPLTASGGYNNIKVLLEASDCSNGNSYSNKTCESGNFNTSDAAALIARALDKCKGDFLSTIQSKFTDIVNNGRPLNVQFRLTEGSTWNFNKEIDGTPLTDVIEAWVAETAVNNNFNSQAGTEKFVAYEIRVPLKDEKGKNFTPKNFALKIYNWLKTKSIMCTKEVINGKIFITLK